MLPTVEERLDSVIRALETVVLDSLPADAILARDQIQVSMGHLSIIRNQIGMLADFERSEREDATRLALALASHCHGGAKTQAAKIQLQGVADPVPDTATRAPNAQEINAAISNLLDAVFADGSAQSKDDAARLVISCEIERTNRDRQIFKPYGFDG